MGAPLESLVADRFTLRVREGTADSLHVSWLGRADDRQPSLVLSPFFESLLVEAKTRGSREIVFHFEDLEHFNSSTIASIVQFVEQASAEGLHLVLTYDPGKRWQKMTFAVLRRLEGERMEVQEIGSE